ncbi:flagellar export chaperone FliS [Borreliella valaisiana]|uniref:Flagellar secretion chaperone FliS n=1 Tax=Borreliella valaisiana VS116 TaxID=445987 RepID=D6RY34_BORVA|nr:flagellar export chaperone FliS [Borreliella valaisiana]AIJ29900.1 flagellar biosynthesis protein FliS [Borreliella valaisiana Tom4006]EEF81709.1 flagellar protein FliS [Borreliella valaisiana VS116]WKC76257.1 flagellar export chaperone FliS [Borreliella valaisiana]WKC77177.1 flagellar export chaperone FliS [Borreliella valaisiana]WLN25338.1 flagellar export chaperone FliS [Borreliella valaisiana]
MIAKENIYKQTQINTSNPLSILIMLYDKAIQDLKVAKELIQDGNWQNAIKANEKIFHAQEIITELMSTLNFEKGGNISTNLLSIYSFLNKELENVLLKKEIHKIDNVIKQLQILSFTWKKLKKENNVTHNKLGINIVS